MAMANSQLLLHQFHNPVLLHYSIDAIDNLSAYPQSTERQLFTPDSHEHSLPRSNALDTWVIPLAAGIGALVLAGNKKILDLFEGNNLKFCRILTNYSSV